jgi:tRNA pseudouridine13 synthase
MVTIKSQPSDFIVDEVSTIKPEKEGEYTYFKLKKENWTTQRAIHQISRKLRVSKSRIGFAGNKDKQAITTQICSAWNTTKENLEWVRLKDIEITILGQGDERINLGTLKGNKFKITVRDVSKKELAAFAKNFPKVKKEGFLNIFGPQRFGSAGNSHKIGAAIIAGDLEKAVKLFVTEHGDNDRAQEFGKFAKKNWGEWKDILNKCPDFLGLEKAVLNWLVKIPTDFGGGLRNIPKPTRRIFISAYQSEIWNKTAQKSKSKIIKIPPIEIKRMPELNMLGAERARIIKPKRLKQKTNNDVVVLEFELPKGCYATVLIDALFKG